MTVVSSGNAITFAGDGVQTAFDFNFRIFNADDLCAVVRNGDGKQKTLVAGSDFKIISGIGNDSGGKVQYPVSGSSLASGESITLFREIAYTQDLELVDNDPFSARLLNEAFDRGVMRDQQLQEQVDRALKYDISTPGADRLSPQELVKTISAARDEAISARSRAVEAESNARGMLDDAKAAQAGSEAARDNALEAKAGAEKARDAAIKISVGDISALRTPTPVLSGPVEAPEGTTVFIVISNYQSDGITSYEINACGFGSAQISGNTIKWTLGSVDADISKKIEVVCRRRGELYSDIAICSVLVKKIIVQDGPTIVFANSAEGYPGATVSEGVVSAPAHSVGVNNSHQIISAKPEIVEISSHLALLSGSNSSVLKLSKRYTGSIITDQGEGEIVSATGGNAVEVKPFGTVPNNGVVAFSGTQLMLDTRLANDSIVTELGVRTSTTPAIGKIGIYRRDSSDKFTLVASASGVASTPYSYNYLPLEKEYTVPSYGDYYIGVGNTVNCYKADGAGSGVYMMNEGAPIVDTQYTMSSSSGPRAFVSYRRRGSYSATLAQALPGIPTKAFKKPNVSLKIGVGIHGEYLGPKKVLALKSENLIPVMNGPTTGICTMSATSELNADWKAWKAGDRQNGVYGGWVAGSSDTAQTLTCMFSEDISFSAYEITAINTGGPDYQGTPTEFTVEVYNGSAWTQVDSKSGVSPWVAKETRRFELSSTQTCRGVRVNCIDAPRAGYRSIGELALIGIQSTKKAIVVTGSESIKDKILKAGRVHKTILVDENEVEVESASETVVGGANAEVKLTDSTTYTTGGGIIIDPRTPIAGGTKLTEVGCKAASGAESALGIFRKDAAGTYFPVAKSAFHVHSGNKVWEWTALNYTVPNDNKEYYLGLFNKSGQLAYANATGGNAHIWNAAYADDAMGTSRSGYQVGGLAYSMGYKTREPREYLTTITLKNELASAPTSDTEIAIPDRCTLAPANYTFAIDGDDLKITGAEVTLEDNPNFKRLAMAVKGGGGKFKGGKIYIKEKP